jgi:hypothetical protein
MMPITGYILFGIHSLLLLWAVGGSLELILPKVFWKPFTNPEFPVWVLVIHWESVLFASISFIYGYLAQWSKTPLMMAVAYAMMAMVCAIETFGYMTSKTKYLAMTAEYVAYAVILILLFRSQYFTSYFNK